MIPTGPLSSTQSLPTGYTAVKGKMQPYIIAGPETSKSSGEMPGGGGLVGRVQVRIEGAPEILSKVHHFVLFSRYKYSLFSVTTCFMRQICMI